MNRKVKQMMAVLMALILLSLATTSASAKVLFSDPVSPTVNQPKAPAQEEQPSDAGEEQLPEGQLPEELPPEELPEQPPVEEALVALKNAEGSLNIRAAASSESELLGKLPNGARVIVLGAEGNWLRIQYETIVGYVYSQYMEILPPAEEEELPEEPLPEEELLPVEPLPGEEPLTEEQPLPEEEPLTEEQSLPEEGSLSERKINIRDNIGSIVRYGDIITLTAELSGFDDVPYTLQWVVRDPGGDWKEIPGENGLSITFELTPENAASEWRLNVVTE